MDLVWNELEKNASSIFRHNLESILDGAIRTSNAQYHNPEFSNRLEIKLLS